VVLPDAVVIPLPAGLPVIRELGGLAVGGDQGAGAEGGGEAAAFGPLELEAELGLALRIEACLGCVLAVLVNGQEHREVPDSVPVPVDLRAVGHRVLLADLLRRVLETGLVEEVLVEEDVGRVDGVWDSEQGAGLAVFHRVDQLGRVLRQVEAGLLNERRHVQELAGEARAALDSDRPDQVRRAAGSHLRLEDRGRGGVLDDLEG
jgi:hypothetical protein